MISGGAEPQQGATSASNFSRLMTPNSTQIFPALSARIRHPTTRPSPVPAPPPPRSRERPVCVPQGGGAGEEAAVCCRCLCHDAIGRGAERRPAWELLVSQPWPVVSYSAWKRPTGIERLPTRQRSSHDDGAPADDATGDGQIRTILRISCTTAPSGGYPPVSLSMPPQPRGRCASFYRLGRPWHLGGQRDLNALAILGGEGETLQPLVDSAPKPDACADMLESFR